ncbi:MAG: hypothetical protein F4030_08640 [Gammaproteobacteria bacterium]|nr:hypothetical protein [Gammaproteobacteria bacterium]MYH85757.1 hypothetical protein [Gammaproteobacteria bacterium]MYK05035.1 hypothetical protein [Gammaproteobacteria bacterium]
MNKNISGAKRLITKAMEDTGFRARLLANPKQAIERELGVTIADGFAIHIHEISGDTTHLVLPPPSRLTEEERQAALTGQASLAFLKKTMHDPAPPLRPPVRKPLPARISTGSPDALSEAGRVNIRRGLEFLDSAIDENGAWHCIRFNTADPEIPRHYEKPAFISAFCTLALECCEDERARAIHARSLEYIVETMEYPGLWRYYRHLPQDLDSTALCSLLVGSHPWILLERNIPQILANRDAEGRFMTWLLGENEPDVVARFRIEADPVVNANIIAWLGGSPETRPETRDAQKWLETLIREDKLHGASKWYPDTVTIYYSIARAMVRAAPAFDHLRTVLAERILDLRDERGGFANVLHTAQAVSALSQIDSLDRIDAKACFEELLSWQNDDGSWPELLAFGDQTLKWGVFGQIGHASESMTTAFCIEALERLIKADWV